MKDEEIIEDLATKLFNFYFEERNENELFDKINEFLIEKVQKDDLSLKKTYLDLFRAYVTYLARCCPISRNKQFYEKVSNLFEKGEILADPDLSLLASVSYQLIEYKNGVYVLSENRDSALKKFRHDFKYREERRNLPVAQIRKKD